MDAVIAGIGTALPDHFIVQRDSSTAAVAYSCDQPDQARSVQALYRVSGVETRYSSVLKRQDGEVAQRQDFYAPRSAECPEGPTTEARMQFFEQAAGPLAVRSARQALERSGVEPSSITHVITVTCSGFAAPGFDYALIQELPLRATVARTQVGFMGCHAALNALRVARSFVLADPTAVVLVCCVELCSLHYQYGWDPEQIVANSLFADGAAACIVQGRDASPNHESTALRLVANGSMVLPDSADAMTWRVGDNGFRMTLSASVPGLLSTYLSPWLSEWLGRHQLTPSQIKTWAVHPGGPRILKAFADAMHLDPERLDVSREILRDYGNMSSPTLLFILNRLLERRPAAPYVAIGFGPGLAAEAALLR